MRQRETTTGEKLNIPVIKKRSSLSMSSQASGRMIETHIDHPKALASSKFPIFRICLTGGPCAGKTTALVSLTDNLIKMGFNVLTVPEAATLMMKAGAFIQTAKMGLNEQVRFQIQIMRMQMALEDVFLETAIECEQKTVILCDRGVMDGMAYTNNQVWQALLDETAWSTI